jgi:hypothetical protein
VIAGSLPVAYHARQKAISSASEVAFSMEIDAEMRIATNEYMAE